MALHIPKAPGYASMLKDGLEEAVYRNIEACVALTKTTRTTYGPHGQSKIVINHIGKQFVTKDVATILRELEVEHPAAKLLVMATEQQEQEVGDGTNLVFQISGSLLSHASQLLKMGLSVAQITEGFELAANFALESLDQLEVEKLTDIRDVSQVTKVIKTAISSKQVDYSDFLADLVTKACIYVLPVTKHFNVDNIRVVKVIGSGILQSHMVKGMVFHREAEGTVKEASKAKVVVYSCPFDSLQTETKGTVLINTATELNNLTRGEEEQMEKKINELVAAGVKVVITGGKVGELALHYANKANLMIIRLPSKFDVRRVCQITGAIPLPGLTCPTPEEMGYIGKIKCEYIADTKIVVLEEPQSETSIATIVLRGSTESMMDDIERCIDDGINAFKCLTRCNKLVAGAGAFEVELYRKLMDYADKIPSLEQYAIREYAKAMEVIPKSLAENGGFKATDALAQLTGKHHAGDMNTGIITLPGKEPEIEDAYKNGIVDIMAVKEWAIKFSCSAACTVLRVDQLIMAKPAGGPKPRDPKGADDD